MKSVKVDLHVHTPSSKCYEGDKGDTDNNYIKILEMAVQQNIRLLAITDHNTIKGYEHLLDIKNSLLMEKTVLEKYVTTNQQMQENIDQINYKLQLFKKVKLLPGVELTVNPGVHLIILCDDKEKNQLQSFIEKMGYTDVNFGEDEGILTNCDIFQLLNEPYLKDKIVIAPHVDKDKGIFKCLAGEYRCEVFKSDTIKAITCNSASQLKKIKGLLSSDPNYKRNSSVAFINASDAHCVNDVGLKSSFIKIEEDLTYQSLYDAFKSPEQLITDIENPEIISIITNIDANGRAFFIDDIEIDQAESYTKYFCAILNYSYGSLIIGVSKNKTNYNFIGSSLSGQDIQHIIDSCMANITSKFRYSATMFNSELLGNGRFVYIVTIRSESKYLWFIKDTNEVFLTSDNNSIKKASINEIEEEISTRLLQRIKKIDESGMQHIQGAIETLKGITTSTDTLKLAEKIDSRSVILRNFSKIEIIKPDISYSQVQDIINEKRLTQNGAAVGNFYYSYPYETRLSEAYLRCSCPRLDYSMNDYPIEQMEKHLYKGARIVILAKGGSHIIDDNEWSYFPLMENSLLLSLHKSVQEQYSLYSILGWLKSSLLIWYMYEIINSTNLYAAQTIKQIPLPRLKCLEPNGAVDVTMKDMVQLEFNFLTELNRQTAERGIDSDNRESLGVLVEDHNKSITQFAKSIDLCLFSELNIDQHESETIYERLRSLSIYDINI